MATETVNQTDKNLKTKPYLPGMVKASRKTRWLVGPHAPKTVDDLTFTSRDEGGRINWWDVTIPKTNYWHVHQMLGRAYAFEVLDLLNNPEAAEDNTHVMGCISGAIARWMPHAMGAAASGMADGFFGVMSEYISTGTANR